MLGLNAFIALPLMDGEVDRFPPLVRFCLYLPAAVLVLRGR